MFMKRKIISVAAAAALALAAITPDAALAQDRRGYHDDYRGDRHGYYYDDHRDHRRYDRHHRYRRDRDDHGDAVAAGVIGLVLGLAIGAAASERRDPQARCYDNYQRCDPPRRYGYYDQGAYEPGYDGYGPAECTRQVRQWDRYARRYVIVDVPC